jgi:hypothetical protein
VPLLPLACIILLVISHIILLYNLYYATAYCYNFIVTSTSAFLNYYEIMSKYLVEPARPKQQYNKAYALCMLDKEDYTRPCTCTRPHTPYTHTYTRTCSRAGARAHIHTQIFHKYCFSTATMISQTRPIVTLHEHCLSFLKPFRC